MTPATGERHVAVIGAGFAGLAAAVALAARGDSVTLVEAADAVGGKARRVEAAGATVDVGPTLLIDPRSLQALEALAPAGTALGAGVSRLDPALVATFASGRHLALWAEPARLESDLAALGPEAVDDWRRVVDLGARAARLTERFYARGDVAGPRDLLRFLAPGGLALADVVPFVRHRSLGGLVAAVVRTPELRRLLRHCARFVGVDAEQAPAVAIVIPYLLATRGAWHPAGGLSGLAERLRARAVARGAVVRTGQPVDALDLDGERVRAVRIAGGERLLVDGVVAAVDPALVSRWVPRLRARLTPLRPTLSARVAWWVVAGEVPDAVGHRLLFPERSDLEPLYVSVPTAVEPGLAAPGTSIVYALVHGPTGRPATAAFADALCARLVEAGQWPAGRVLAAGVAGGAASCYGSAMRPGLLGGLRPSQRVGGIANLWLAGGAVFPGPGVANALRSGLRAAALAAPVTVATPPVDAPGALVAR
jgi:phytoene desaturase